ncbi:uncharacterized protein LOC133778132 [Humulus lupulus]|uniref:uncharacterized protein LOC133778132 n=1 Tax=Humulus lupulus TaxID=3486 RepID=UPI002B4069A6|nr:uncharacterized protein LOC133778132 [Humulus lupulus]XP_062073939.1 uncharacterized protein LOC133778132 [Humulus lupulus]
MKKLRTSKKATGTPTKSPAKEKEQPPTAQAEGTVPPAAGGSNMPPPPLRASAPTRDAGAKLEASAIVPSELRIPVNPQDLEKIPEAFRGMVYESANYTVSHIYKFNEKELRAIETRSPVGMLESSLGMALTSFVALQWSIARTKTQLEEMRNEHQAAVATHQTSLQTAKDALAASQAELEETRPKLQELETALATARAVLDTAKAEAKAALAAERENLAPPWKTCSTIARPITRTPTSPSWQRPSGSPCWRSSKLASIKKRLPRLGKAPAQLSKARW